MSLKMLKKLCICVDSTVARVHTCTAAKKQFISLSAQFVPPKAVVDSDGGGGWEVMLFGVVMEGKLK